MRQLVIVILAAIISTECSGQDFNIKYQPVPSESGFRMDGYWVWCGSVIKVDSTYHLFASRWKKTAMFPENYRNDSEIVRATSPDPLGPYKFQEVVIGERDSSFWDSNMAHNPAICKIGNEYVLYYIGSDFTTRLPGTRNLLRRVGFAVASDITGPWHRSDRPVIKVESNNPSVLFKNGKILLIYRNEDLRVFLTEAKSFRGPYKMVNDNVWPENMIEDFYLFQVNDQLHMICEDNSGRISGHERWGVHLYSDDAGATWKKYDPVVLYDHELVYNNSTLQCTRRERPHLIIENGRITHLITGVFDGRNSWSQPVRLADPVSVE